jgi:hypothetical protein
LKGAGAWESNGCASLQYDDDEYKPVYLAQWAVSDLSVWLGAGRAVVYRPTLLSHQKAADLI